MKKKTAPTTTATPPRQMTPPSAPFLSQLLGSIGRSDPNDVDSFCAMIALADGHIDALLARGVFGDAPLDATIAALVPEYERARNTSLGYTVDVNAIERGDWNSDRICHVRYAEKEAAFALGVTLGLRMSGGTR